MMPRTESRCFQASESCAQCDWRLRRSLEKVSAHPNLATEVASQATDKVMRGLELSCRTRLEFDRGVRDGMGMETTKMGGFRTMVAPSSFCHVMVS